jgi:hypothetical protein
MRATLEALAEGSELAVEVVGVREGNGPRGLQIEVRPA